MLSRLPFIDIFIETIGQHRSNTEVLTETVHTSCLALCFCYLLNFTSQHYRIYSASDTPATCSEQPGCFCRALRVSKTLWIFFKINILILQIMRSWLWLIKRCFHFHYNSTCISQTFTYGKIYLSSELGCVSGGKNLLTYNEQMNVFSSLSSTLLSRVNTIETNSSLLLQHTRTVKQKKLRRRNNGRLKIISFCTDMRLPKRIHNDLSYLWELSKIKISYELVY